MSPSGFGRYRCRGEAHTETSGGSRVTLAGRAALLGLLAWWTAGFVPRPLDAERTMGSFLHLVHLAFHEAGHLFFAPFGDLAMSLGGSLTQVLVPVVCALAFLRRHDWCGALVCAWWVGASLIDLAPYMADARALQLPLLGGGTGAEVEGHDWESILSRMGWLRHDRTLGLAAHIADSLLMLSALASGVALLVRAGVSHAHDSD